MSSFPHRSFFYLRHGETDYNKQHLAMGQMDVPLNETGLAQAQSVSTFFLQQNTPFKSIAVSPLKRALKTAEIISGDTGIPITVIDDLQERSWGKAEGKPKGKLAWFEKWQEEQPFEEAELLSEFNARVLKAMIKALNLPGPVLVVAHGAVYWSLQTILQHSYKNLPNCVPVSYSPPTYLSQSWTSD